MSKIKTIIFDFGDVFINLDKVATSKNFLKLGVSENFKSEMHSTLLDYERGLITTKKFLVNFNEKFPKIPSQKIIDAWNSMILDFPEHRLEFIENLALKNKYKLLLLSNTNDLHMQQVIKNMGRVRFSRFKNCFDKFYLSQHIHLTKPANSIYEFVLHSNNLQADECLFIDDLKENTEAALKMGIHVWNIIPTAQDVTQLFDLKTDIF